MHRAPLCATYDEKHFATLRNELRRVTGVEVDASFIAVVFSDFSVHVELPGHVTAEQADALLLHGEAILPHLLAESFQPCPERSVRGCAYSLVFLARGEIANDEPFCMRSHDAPLPLFCRFRAVLRGASHSFRWPLFARADLEPLLSKHQWLRWADIDAAALPYGAAFVRVLDVTGRRCSAADVEALVAAVRDRFTGVEVVCATRARFDDDSLFGQFMRDVAAIARVRFIVVDGVRVGRQAVHEKQIQTHMGDAFAERCVFESEDAFADHKQEALLESLRVESSARARTHLVWHLFRTPALSQLDFSGAFCFDAVVERRGKVAFNDADANDRWAAVLLARSLPVEPQRRWS